MKKIWITALDKEDKRAALMAEGLKPYGLQTGGAYWEDNLQERAWQHPVGEIIKHDMWLIVAPSREMGEVSVRYGLSLCAIQVLAQKGLGFPIVIAFGGELPDADELPTPLAGADLVSTEDATLGATLTAKVHAPGAAPSTDYRLDVHGPPQGVCFEVGPAEGAWNGAIFGAAAETGGVDVQAVGPRGKLPENTTLNYPQKDLKLKLGDTEYVAWAARNAIDQEISYFALVHGEPTSILFGAFPDSDADDAEVFVVKLL